MYARRIPYRFSVQTLALVIIIVQEKMQGRTTSDGKMILDTSHRQLKLIHDTSLH